jgi:hypothetical protein
VTVWASITVADRRCSVVTGAAFSVDCQLRITTLRYRLEQSPAKSTKPLASRAAIPAQVIFSNYRSSRTSWVDAVLADHLLGIANLLRMMTLRIILSPVKRIFFAA